MQERNQVKTMQEYAKELALVAPSEEVEAFKKLYEEGKRIHAVQILRKYKLA